LTNSTGGVSAAKKIGRILAERAEESGILQVFVDDQYKEDNSTKVLLIELDSYLQSPTLFGFSIKTKINFMLKFLGEGILRLSRK